MLHPATLLVVWAGFAFALPLLPLNAALATMAVALAASLAFARRRSVVLLRRSRWLLLSIALLFAFATPGLSVPGWPGRIGLTQDGLLLAAEHLARLVILLTTLALLHEHLKTAGLLTGLHALLGLMRNEPLRERIAVRVMLVVEFIEGREAKAGWRHWLDDDDRGPDRLTLAVRRLRWPDWTVFAAMAVVGSALAW